LAKTSHKPALLGQVHYEIKENTQERIFQSFEQANAGITGIYGGTGLGLVISKKLGEHMASDIVLISNPNLDAIFSFTLSVQPIAFAPEIKKENQEVHLS